MSPYNGSNDHDLQMFIQEMHSLIDGGQLEFVSGETVQALFGLAMKMYIQKLEQCPHLPPFAEGHAVSATDAVIAVSKILKQVDLQVFELAMWQTMGTVK
jgi:hypothetical protein